MDGIRKYVKTESNETYMVSSFGGRAPVFENPRSRADNGAMDWISIIAANDKQISIFVVLYQADNATV